MTRLVIVTGASGDVGAAYVAHYALTDCTVIAIHRSPVAIEVPGASYRKADLANKEQALAALHGLPIAEYDRITIIHPVGMFKWEETGLPAIDADGNGIDDEVERSNIITYEHIVEPVLHAARSDALIDLVGFGSLSDYANVPYWQSYTKAKNLLREKKKLLDAADPRVRAIMINLPSVKTKNEKATRPHADMTYWMDPVDIVLQTIADIDSAERGYVELNRYQPSPTYKEGYYQDHGAVYTHWKQGMDGKK